MKIRFGMLAVDAYGKAGGQCIQRHGSIRVLRNITIPTQRLSSTQNPQRFLNSQLFNKWQFLSVSDRDMWSEVGSNISRKNGWGEDHALSGRQAFGSFNAIMYPYTNALVDPTLFNYEAVGLTVASIIISKDTTSFVVNHSIIGTPSFYQMKGLRLSSRAVNPDVSKLSTFFRVDNLFDDVDIYLAFSKYFKNILEGQIFSIAIRAINESGVTSPWVQLQVEVAY